VRFTSALAVLLVVAAPATAHDIPNDRVDRSIQATVSPGRLAVDYEVSLADLTLLQDLRRLVGTVEAADRNALFQRYGEVVGPLNAKGFLVEVDGEELALHAHGFDLAIEEHPRYTFHLATKIPASGRLKLIDTNYVSSEGTSRLAIRGASGITVSGDSLPRDVEQIPIRPVWQLSNAEEKRTKRVEVSFASPAPGAFVKSEIESRQAAPKSQRKTPPDAPRPRLGRLLDRAFGLPALLAFLLALGLGAAHSLQPGHGKTLMAASVVSHRAGPLSAVLLALLTTLTHMAVVCAIAVGLWLAQTTRYAEIHAGLARTAGLAIAIIGVWKLGRHVGGHGEHSFGAHEVVVGKRSLIGLGVAGGLIPCWDAVALVLVADLVGRLAFGLVLVAAFSLGMAIVLVSVGVVAGRVSQLTGQGGRFARLERRVGVAAAVVLTAMGLWLAGGSG
jgi:ABC-type nickel/cobalt efflux system permease component RcnA